MKNLILFIFLSVNLFLDAQTTAFSETFESANSLTLTNGTQTNKWFRGSANQCNGLSALYISNNNSSYAYTITSSSTVHAYLDVVIPSGATNIQLSFNRKLNGEASFDYLQTWSCINSFSPTAGTLIASNANRVLLGTLQGQTVCATTTYNLPNTIAGTTRRIIFTWRNDASGGVSPPALLDNIAVTYTPSTTAPSCIASPTFPTNSATNIATNQILSWAAASGATGYDVYFGNSPTPPLVSTNQAGTSYTPTLSTGTTYYWKIVPRNSVGLATGCSTWSFTTLTPPSNDLCSGATSLPCATSNLAGTTLNSVSETPPASSVTSSFGVWYKFTGDGQQTTISSTAVFDHEMVILSGISCGSFSIIASKDDALSNSVESYTFTTTNLQQYYVWIAHYSTGNTTTGTFTISRTCTAPPSPPTNDNPSEAIELTITNGINYVTYTNLYSSNTTTESTPSCASYIGEDVWFKIIVPQHIYALDFDTQTGNITDAGMAIYRGTIGALIEIECDDDDSPNGAMPYITRSDFNQYETIYIRVWEYGGGTTGTFKISITSPQALPVELLYFEGIEYPTFNNLKWATASEQNSSHFIVEKSINGETWREIANKPSAGNSTENINYYYLDNIDYFGLNYYRLVQHDIDGQFKVYGPIALDNTIKVKKVVKYVNLMGQEVGPEVKGVVFEVYEDGTSKKILR